MIEVQMPGGWFMCPDRRECEYIAKWYKVAGDMRLRFGVCLTVRDLMLAGF